MLIDKMDINYIEGREEKAMEAAQKMLQKKSYAIEEIADITGLEPESILQLKKELDEE